MFLKTEIMLIAEKLRPTCMTQFPHTLISPLRYWPMRKEVSSQWSHSIGLALSCSPRKFQNICLVVLCRYPFGYLAQQADHVVAILTTDPHRTNNPFVGTVLHPSPIVQLIVRSFNCPQVDCLHIATFALLLIFFAACYRQQPRHQYRTATQCSHNTISLLKQRCCINLPR